MIKSIFKSSLLILCLVVGMSTVVYNNDRLFEISKNIELFVNVFKELNKNYVDEVDPSELMKIGIDAMVGSLDPFTNYITETQVERYRISDDDKYQGIGAAAYVIDNKTYLAELMEGGAAVNAGLHAGDEIVSINGDLIKNKTEQEVMSMLRGTQGTPVKININRNGTGKNETITVERSEVNIPNVPYAGMLKDGIGYINLTVFTDNAGANINKELKRLKKEAGDDSTALKGIVLDLRHNGGGLLREAISICNLFIPKGEEVVFTRGKIKDKDQSFKTMAIPYDLDLPIAVLVDKKSASASEIVSGVLQDKDRGVILGQRSYGKGLVQNTFEIGYNSRVKVTTSKYHIPSGRCIQGVEYKNGEPVDIADNKRSKFKTKNGRTVLDGGGVTPDVKLDLLEQSTITKALLDQKVIFSYVNGYVAKNDSIKNMDLFSFTGYDDFLSFLKKQKFTYMTEGEKELEALNEIGNKSIELKPMISNDISLIRDKIIASKAKDLTKHKEEIITEIEKEILSRYFYIKGKTKHKLKKDKEVDEAIALLKDQKRYKSILGVK
jgi:carboxyl-terminal processing protease